ncbi:MAG: hypothetical protein K2Y37_04605 [Pirellulales bacterium]|nr:hypothetical protein [Pirellulales bacterium]
MGAFHLLAVALSVAFNCWLATTSAALEPDQAEIVETADGELMTVDDVAEAGAEGEADSAATASDEPGREIAIPVGECPGELPAEAPCPDDDSCDCADENFEGYPVLGPDAPPPPVCCDVRLCIDPCQKAQGEFWVVSTRNAPVRCNLDQGLGCIEYYRRTGRDSYERYSLDEFLMAMDPSLPTCIYVHGNTLDWDGAIEGGTRVYRKIGRGIHGFRLVLWSWPAERLKGYGLEGNIVEKADRSESQGYYLAWLVDLLDPRVPLSLVGHSYGCRTVTAGLQGLATGHIACYDLPERHYIGWRPMEACLVAAAMDKWLLTPRGRHALAVTQIDRMLITTNPDDRTLALLPKWFPWEALGLNGLPERPIAPYDQRVLQLESTSWVNKAHRFQAYAHDRELADRLRPYFFYLDAPEPIPAELVPSGDPVDLGGQLDAIEPDSTAPDDASAPALPEVPAEPATPAAGDDPS